MLNVSPLITIVPVVDMVRARDFYEHKLGLKPEGAQSDGSVIYSCGTALLELYHKPDGTKADHPIMSFEVYDIKSEIRALERKGVLFKDADQPDFKTVGHVIKIGDEKEAWFKDSEGNYLCLHQTLH